MRQWNEHQQNRKQKNQIKRKWFQMNTFINSPEAAQLLKINVNKLSGGSGTNDTPVAPLCDTPRKKKVQLNDFPKLIIKSTTRSLFS